MVDSTPTATATAIDDQVDAPGRGRPAHGPPWSATHGPTDWPTAPPPARQRRAGYRARRRGPESGSRRCRARRWRVRPPRNPLVLGNTSVSGPGQNASASALAWASNWPIRRAAARSPTWAISGIEGRPALGLIEPGDGARRWWRRRRGRKPSRSGTRSGRLGQATRRGGRGGLAGGQNLGFQGHIHRDSNPLVRLLAVCETQGYKPPSCRSVAQPGRALRSGRRGRRFESCHSDQEIIRFFRSDGRLRPSQPPFRPPKHIGLFGQLPLPRPAGSRMCDPGWWWP